MIAVEFGTDSHRHLICFENYSSPNPVIITYSGSNKVQHSYFIHYKYLEFLGKKIRRISAWFGS